LADTDGNIGYSLIGSVPVRKNNFETLGSRVISGSNSEYEWIGFETPINLPFVLNPSSGFFVSANS
jgi:acyl-homoserine lactone acylase PvdQ